MKSVGMAIHSPTSFDDTKGVRILKEFLESKNTIKTFFSENDKTPNHDGFFELIDVNNKIQGIPKKQFIVQIKKADSNTTSLELQENGTYKYNLDTKFLYYIKEKVAESPAIYFVIDVATKKIFYIYLSDEKLMSLNFEGKGSIVYYFNDNEQPSDIDSFTKKLTKIANYRNNIFINKTEKEITELQDAVENINNLFNNDLLFIKEQLFPNLWRFGIGSSTDKLTMRINEENSTIYPNANMFGLYPQVKGKKDFGYKEYCGDNIFSHFDMTGNMTPNQYVSEVIEKILDEYFNKHYLIKYVSKQIIEELLSEAVNKLETNLGIKIERNREEKIEIKSIYKTLYIVTSYINNVIQKKDLTSQEKSLKQIILQRLNYLMLDNNIDSVTLISMLTRKEFIDFYKHEYKSINENRIILNRIFLGAEYEEYIAAMQRAKELEVTSINVKKSLNVYETSEEELYNFCYNWFENLKVIYEEIYNQTMKNNAYKKRGIFKYCLNINEKEGNSFGRINWNLLKCESNILDIEIDKSLKDKSFEIIKERNATSMKIGCCISAFLGSKKCLYSSLCSIFYEGICEGLNIKCRGIGVGGARETLLI